MTVKIISAKIGPFPMHLFDPLPKVHVFFEDGTNEVLFEFYFDEITFNEKELIGLTKEQVFELKKKKDIEYLQS